MQSRHVGNAVPEEGREKRQDRPRVAPNPDEHAWNGTRHNILNYVKSCRKKLIGIRNCELISFMCARLRDGAVGPSVCFCACASHTSPIRLRTDDIMRKDMEGRH